MQKKWVDLLFTSALSHNFTQVKVKEVGLTQRPFFVKFSSSNLKIKVQITVAGDKLTV